MNPLVLKLRCGARLTDEDERKLDEICVTSRWIEPHQDIICEGDRPEDVHLVLEGLACRYKLLQNGQRQILALMVPGDFCDLNVAILGAMDHSIATIKRSRVVDISRDKIDDLTSNYPRILRGLWWATLVDEAVLREWLVSMGQRGSGQQMAHFFCEMFVRLGLIDQVKDDTYNLGLTQTELSDTLGLSTVHVNRTLQELRGVNLIRFRGGQVSLPDPQRLFTFAGFNSNYLHLLKRERADSIIV